MKYPVDLGTKSGIPACMPQEGGVHYPSLYLDDIKLPEHGTMTVEFHRTSMTNTDRDGKESSSCCVEIRKILKVDGEEMKEEDTSAILDALLKAAKGDED